MIKDAPRTHVEGPRRRFLSAGGTTLLGRILEA